MHVRIRELFSRSSLRWEPAHAVSSVSGSAGVSGRGAIASWPPSAPIASLISADFEPKCRNSVISLTPASDAMRRVVAPRNPVSAYTRAAALRSFSRISIGRGA